MNKLLAIEPNNSEALAQKAIAYDYYNENIIINKSYKYWTY